jgi:phosphoglycerate dehydrogenase-like enzyme
MKKLRCAILDDYQNVALMIADWEPILNNVEVVSFQQHFSQEKDLIKILNPYEIIVIMRERTPFFASLLKQLPHLKLLITSGMRNASIDLNAAEKQGIVVCGTASLSEPPTELTWALILGLARKIVQENNAFRTNGFWQTTLGVDLHGKQLGILGLGKIGSRVAQIAKAFGMNVVAWSPHLTLERATKEGVAFAVSKEELLKNSDFISIHLVLSETTKNLISTADFNCMRSSAYLVNTSRAQIIDQEALVVALKNKKIAGVGLDVFEIEPLPKDHVLRTLPNVLATPHLGYVSQKNYKTYFTEAVENIAAFIAEKPIRMLV